MARWSGRATVSLAGALLLGGCFGGQTGEPGQSTCVQRKVPANDRTTGTSPAELGQAYTGRYTATLEWTPPASTNTGVALGRDELTLDVAYEGAAGSFCNELDTEVTVTVTTGSGLAADHGIATLEQIAPDSADLVFNGESTSMIAILRKSSGGGTASGTLELNGVGRATFPSPSSDGGTPGRP